MKPMFWISIILDWVMMMTIILNANSGLSSLVSHSQQASAETAVILLCIITFTVAQESMWPRIVGKYGNEIALSIAQVGSAISLFALSIELHYITSVLGLIGISLFRVSYQSIVYAYVLAHANPPTAKTEFRSIGLSRSISTHIANLVAFGIFGTIKTTGDQAIANGTLGFIAFCYLSM